MRASLLLTAAGCLISLAPSVSSQRAIRQITSIAQPHQDAKISPDGTLVAFKGPGKIGVVPFAGGAEGTLASGVLTDFVWAPTSSGVYYFEGAALKFATRFGGSLTLSTQTGTRHRVWCVDSADDTLWCTRFNASTSETSIFTVGTNGAGATDIVTELRELDQVRIDPTDTKILYRAHDAVPFAPNEFLCADPDGSNPVSLTGGEIGGQLERADWVDDGLSVAFSMISPTTNFPHLARIDSGSTQIRMLTEGTVARRLGSVTPDRSWVLCAAQHAAGVVPAVIPPSGGGLVLLEPDAGESYTFQSAPTADTSGNRIAFAAVPLSSPGDPQIFAVELDRELRIFPRAEIGSSFQVDMLLDPGETGIVYLGAGGPIAPITLPGWVYGLALGGPRVPVVSGVPVAGSITTSIPVPNEPLIVGVSVFFQGLRISAAGLEFTRYADVRIF